MGGMWWDVVWCEVKGRLPLSSALCLGAPLPTPGRQGNYIRPGEGHGGPRQSAELRGTFTYLRWTNGFFQFKKIKSAWPSRLVVQVPKCLFDQAAVAFPGAYVVALSTWGRPRRPDRRGNHRPKN